MYQLIKVDQIVFNRLLLKHAIGFNSNYLNCSLSKKGCSIPHTICVIYNKSVKQMVHLKIDYYRTTTHVLKVLGLLFYELASKLMLLISHNMKKQVYS